MSNREKRLTVAKALKDGNKAAAIAAVEGIEDRTDKVGTLRFAHLTKQKLFEQEGIDATYLLPERQDLLLETMLKKNSEEFGHDPETKEIPGFPELTKYLWYWDENRVDTVHSEGSRVSTAGEVSSKNLKALGSLLLLVCLLIYVVFEYDSIHPSIQQ